MQTLILSNEHGDLIKTVSRQRLLDLPDGNYEYTEAIKQQLKIVLEDRYSGSLSIEVVNG